MKNIWNKIKLILLWLGISILLMVVGAIVIGVAAMLLVVTPFLILFPSIREKIWEDLIINGGWKKRKVEGKIEKIQTPPQTTPKEEKISEDAYYFFSR